MHELIRPEDPARIFAKGGVIEVLLAAQEAGKARHLGFTSRKNPDIHLKMQAIAKEQPS